MAFRLFVWDAQGKTKRNTNSRSNYQNVTAAGENFTDKSQHAGRGGTNLHSYRIDFSLQTFT